MGFNKGEWSELYTFLSLLIEPNLVIVDENLKIINQNTFEIQEIYTANKTAYQIYENNIIKISPKDIEKAYSKQYLATQKILLLHKITTHKKSKGSFEIDELKVLTEDLLDGNTFKGSSKTKGDLEALVLDKRRDHSIKLNYNIKSNLGAKATLLNASSHTNFIYEVTHINDKIMQENNAIKTRKKLIDKCDFLTSKGAKFTFIKTKSDVFGNNLKLIDSNLDKILAQMLLLSYQENEKDIKLLSEIWNGTNEVNGGIILVTKAVGI